MEQKIKELIEKYEKELIVLKRRINEHENHPTAYHEYTGEIDKLEEVILDLKDLLK